MCWPASTDARRLGETGVRVLMRLVGLVLAAIAVQFVINGLADRAGLVDPPQD